MNDKLHAAALSVALSLSDGQLASIRGPVKPGTEIHIPRWGVKAIIDALDCLAPGQVERTRAEMNRS